MDILSYPRNLAETTYRTLGLEKVVKDRLRAIAGGVEPTVGWLQYQPTKWESTSNLDELVSKKRLPMYITTTWRAPDPDNPEKNLHLAGGIWIDIDQTDIADAVLALKDLVSKLVALDIPLECCSLFASGGKGFHIFIPLGLLHPGGIDRVGVQTARHFPYICREFVMGIVVDGVDLTIYSKGKGHQIRQVAVQRDNGAYKVPVGWNAWLGLNAESYKELCSQPRPWIEPVPVQGLAVGAAVAWECAGHTVVRTAVKAANRPTATTTRQQEADRPKIIKLLRGINADALDYADWLRVGAVLKRWGAPDALDLWKAFSKTDGKRYRPGVCESKWPGLTGAGVGTLVVIARAGGRP